MSHPSARRPRDAATLVLYRYERETLQVLMGQRHGKHAFMPNRYVFPGGAVDADDRYVKPAGELRPAVAANLAKSCSPARARSLAAAAIRETWEETGLLVARRAAKPEGKIRGSWRPFHDNGLAPALDELDYICRAVTPPGRPRRFNARFFVARADTVTGKLGGDGELHDLGWLSIRDALALPIPDITAYALSELQRWLRDGPAPEGIPLLKRVGREFSLIRE